jgi:hypothetical protein
MRAIHSARAIGLAGVLGACMLFAGAAQAASDTERQGSILIFAKVVNDSQRDTVIQITNTGNMVNRARCFYLNGDTCRITDFDISLTKQQPTHWRAGEGRRVDLLDPFGSDGAGIDPGTIPAVPEGFAGALICVEVNTDGEPVAMNKLKGEATLLDVTDSGTNNTSQYNGITFPGLNGNLDANLQLNGTEYSACTDQHQLNFYSMPDQPDPVIGEASAVAHNLTVLPCNLDLTRRNPSPFTINYTAYDEFEIETSFAISGSCWANVSLNDLDTGGGQSTFQTMTLRTTNTNTPVMLLSESFHTDTDTGATGSAASNVHQTGASSSATIKMLILP